MQRCKYNLNTIDNSYFATILAGALAVLLYLLALLVIKIR